MPHPKQKQGPKQTKNKAQKAARAAQQAERLRAVERNEPVVQKTTFVLTEKKPNMNHLVINRRKKTIANLRFQLDSKTKKDLSGNDVPLEKDDIKRINAEISILEKRI